MRLNIENCARNGDEGAKAWALDELVRNLKEMRDRSNSGDMQAAVTEFFEVFRFSDNQTDPSPVRAALAAQPGAVAAKNNDVDRLLRQVFLLCEAVEDLPEIDPKNEHERGFDKGRRFQAKQIRRAIGDWFQWTFCGSSFMGEPVLSAAPTEAKPATQQASGEREALTEPGRDLIAGVLRCAAWTHDAVGAPALAKQAREALETFKRAALSMPAQQDAVDAVIPLDKDELAQLIAEHLGGTYHCTRVWEAWNVGTMSQDDFEPVDESETPTEIADAIIDAIRAAISAKKVGAA